MRSTIHIHAEVSPELHSRFKEACLRNHSSMQAMIEVMITEFVEKQEKIPATLTIKRGTPNWLSQALIEGGGVYKP